MDRQQQKSSAQQRGKARRRIPAQPARDARPSSSHQTVGVARQSPAQQKASAVKRKYQKGYKLSPGKGQRVRKALFEVRSRNVSIRQAARDNQLSFSYIQRRAEGGVEVDSRCGPEPFFQAHEESAFATYLSEMALRGMGLTPGEFLDLIQTYLRREKRTNPFTDDRPGYGWYYAFMARNAAVLETRKEVPLEASRAKVTPHAVDLWFEEFAAFLSSKHLLDKPQRIWNADESGFSMGSKPGSVIGPNRASNPEPIPHLSGGATKQRLTVMYCGSAEGQMMPPFFVYPQPVPTAYNPMLGSKRGSTVVYTKKGWMNAVNFHRFLEHFHANAGTERPVLLLIDSVSSHVDIDVFRFASERGIELYRIVPNATHLMQPMDKGVFGPLKREWYSVIRKHTKANPGQPIGKQHFAQKLNEAFDAFYKPATVASSFRSSGIYPVCRAAVSNDRLKPSLTFVEPSTSGSAPEPCTSKPSRSDDQEQSDASTRAFEVFSSVLTTPTRAKYETRVAEGFDISGSPTYMAYAKLYEQAGIGGKNTEDVQTASTSTSVPMQEHLPSVQSSMENSPLTGLGLLAEAAYLASPDLITSPNQPPGFEATALSSLSNPACNKVSPVLQNILELPRAPPPKPKRKRILDTLPDCLTSPSSIRMVALQQLKAVEEKAEKEKRAKERYMKRLEKDAQKAERERQKEIKNAERAKRGKQLTRKGAKSQAKKSCSSSMTTKTLCIGCDESWEDDEEMGLDTKWIQCDECDMWLHQGCIPDDHEYDQAALVEGSDVLFVCHVCSL
jgi:hypothetical protein